MTKDNFTNSYGFSKREWDSCIAVLQKLKESPFNNPDNKTFGALITKIHKQAKKQLKQQNSQEKKATDWSAIKATTIVDNALNNRTQYSTASDSGNPSYTPLGKSRNCYCCNDAFDQLHFFYHKLCPQCAESNYQQRQLPIDLSGKKIILTGGRVKIGFATALKILRSNGDLTITTRFPALALQQFNQEKDYDSWKDRLTIYGLDLRNLKAVNQFIDFYQSENKHLDILINNAAQTIKYDQAYYQPLLAQEQKLLATQQADRKLLPNQTPVLQELKPAAASPANFTTALNRFGQPVDYRKKTSWNSTLAEIELPELLEVHLINHISPYLLIQGLTPHLQASPNASRFIINVTSSEGQFSYQGKTKFHPHTNMTKAALNMLTRTSAVDYLEKGIFMNSVDVGWVSTGAHEVLRAAQFAKGQIPPLDSVDGCARILHPIYERLYNNSTIVGSLFKDFKVATW